MDLIDRSKAVRELHEIYDDMQYELVYENGETLANEVENILASLPQENQWIPCSERLPKENKDDLHNFLFSDVVMVTVYDIERDKVMGVNCDMTIDGKWQGYQSCDGTEVIAWQPLPEPYKTESEDKEMSEISETEIKSMTKEQNYMRGYKDGKSDVIDKIRAEIEQIIGERNLDDYDFCSGLICARKIIDKYKKEGEK